MMPYLRLHLLRLTRVPIGRSAILASLILPPTLVAGLHLLARLPGGPVVPQPEILIWGNSFLGMVVALCATGWIPASLLQEERTERRISVLRSAGIDGAGAAIAMIAISLTCAIVLVTCSLATSTLLAAFGRVGWTILGQQHLGGILAGLALGSLGTALEVLVGRAAWAVVNGGLAILSAILIAEFRTLDADLRTFLLMNAALLAIGCCASALLVLHFGARLTRSRLETWS